MNSYFFKAPSLLFHRANQLHCCRLVLSAAFLTTSLLFPACFAIAQEAPVYGDTLSNVTISEDEARNILKGLFDVTRLSHSLAIGKIARDERLTAFTDGFVQRNNIEVLTIGYIDSDQFWPRVFREQRLGKIEKTETDMLLAAKIIFMPDETNGTVSGYNVTLELTGKTQQVYELLQVSRENIDSIASQTSQQQLSTPFATPSEAKETVVNALIAALEGVEEKAYLGGESPKEDLQYIENELVKEILLHFKATINSYLENDDDTAKVLVVAGWLPGQMIGAIDNIDGYLEQTEVLLSLIKEDSINKNIVDELAARLAKNSPPYKTILSEAEWDNLLEIASEYLVGEMEQVQYYLPITVSVGDDYYLIDKEKTSFVDEDTIQIQAYMDGVALTVIDSLGQEIAITNNNFKEIEGRPWSPGFIIDIKDLDIDVYKSFEILIENLDTVQLFVVKEEITEDLAGAALEAFKDYAEEGIEDGESWNSAGYACNNAVRAFLYHHKADAVLFPETMPDKEDNFRYGSGLGGPDDETVLKGLISWDGTADKMWDDFDGSGNDLTGSFTEIAKSSIETWNNYFDRLQKQANKGSIIVGLVHSDYRSASRGHIVALMPKSLCGDAINQTTADDVGDEEEDNVKRPCAIEAGGNVKEIVWFKQNSNEIDNYKWFEYND